MSKKVCIWKTIDGMVLNKEKILETDLSKWSKFFKQDPSVGEEIIIDDREFEEAKYGFFAEVLDIIDVGAGPISTPGTIESCKEILVKVTKTFEADYE